MPLYAPISQADPTPEPPPTPPEWRPDPDVEAPYVTWTLDGRETRLLACGQEAEILRGVLGLDLPPVHHFESELAAGDGSLHTGQRFTPRDLLFPVMIRARSLTEFERRRRRLMADFNPRHAGWFRWQLPDGTWRELRCRLTEIASEGGHQGGQIVNKQTWRVGLRAVDPFWYGGAREESWAAPGALDFYNGGAAPPYNISQSNTLGTVTVDIDGEVETWPEWWLRGPMTTARLAHPELGALDLAPQMPAGRGMLIRTDERLESHLQVVIGDVVQAPGGDWRLDNTVLAWDRVSGQFPVLWPLQPGTQTIEVFAAGTSPESSIRMSYRTRYLTA